MALIASAYTPSAQWNGNNWMKHISGSTFACDVTIPGSHDSATGEGWDSGLGATTAQAQDVTIANQLLNGVRAFDLRPKATKNGLKCVHGIMETKVYFSDVFATFEKFLEENPSEFIVIHIYHGGSSDESGQSYESMMYDFTQDHSKYLARWHADLTVDDLRGKILLLAREGYSKDGNNPPYGGVFYDWREQMDWSDGATKPSVWGSVSQQRTIYTQDVADATSTAKQNAKKNCMKELLDRSTARRAKCFDDCIWYFNFCSAYDKNISSDGYRGNATVMNPFMYDYLKASWEAGTAGPAGIVLADYVCTDKSSSYNTMGTELVGTLIDNNFKYLEWQEDGTIHDRPTYVPSAGNVEWDMSFGAKFLGNQRSGSIIADFDGNGTMDILNGGCNDNAYYKSVGANWSWQEQSNLYLQNTDGTWDERIIDWNGNWWTNPHGIAPLQYPHYRTLDYNNDGLVDVLAAGVTDGNDQLGYRNQAGYNCQLVKDGDDNTKAVFQLYKNNGDGTFEMVNSGLPVFYVWQERGNSEGCSSLKQFFDTGDYDHDGYVDIVVGGFKMNGPRSGEWGLYLYKNNGDGTFSGQNIYDCDKAFPKAYGFVRFVDLNNDGWLDIFANGETQNMTDIAGSGGGQRSRLFINNEGKSFSNGREITQGWQALRNGGSDFADFNNDGYLDFICGGYSDFGYGWGSFLYYNSGDSNRIFSNFEDLTKRGVDGDENYSLYCYDFNYDGNMDIHHHGSGNNKFFIGSEGFTFNGQSSHVRDLQGRVHDSNAALGDINGDGKVDKFQTGQHWFDGDQANQRFGSEGNYYYDATAYINKSAADIKAPEAPHVSYAGWIGGQLFAEWDDIDDKTIAYNVIFVDPNGKIYSNLPVDINTGKLRVSQGKKTAIRPGVGRYAIDHTVIHESNTMRARPMTGYRIGVQAVSLANETASPISWYDTPTGVDDIIDDAANENRIVNVSVDGGNVTVVANTAATVVIYDTLGRTVATGVTNIPINVPAKGVLLVKMNNTTVKIAK